jgi:nitroreductase
MFSAAAPTEKIPRIEQLLSAGAAAENILLAAQALGYGAVWKTGGPAYDPDVKRALGLTPEDDIVAFLYMGAPASDAPAKPPAPRPEPGEVLEDWRGNQAALAPADA